MGTTGVSGAAQTSKEGFGSFIEGLVKGSLSDNDSWSATLGSVVGGLIPGIGLLADIRDLGAAVAHVTDGRDGAWFELGASIIGFVPGGDIAKGIARSAQKAMAKTAVKVGAELADDAAKVIKGSTAAAADGLSSAQKTAGNVHAPRGPPGGETLKPGTFGTESIPAQVGRPTVTQQRQVNDLMQRNGCHTCGTKNAQTTRGNAVADHQPPKALGTPTQFYPHCIKCARRQGGEVVQELRARRKAGQ
jgi:hypothetical protein